MQEEPLDMFSYGIGILLLIKRLKSPYPYITHTWYADNSGALVTFDNLEKYFKSLKRNGPAWGYYPDPIKIIMITHPKILKRGGCLEDVMGLRCEQVHIILAVISRMTNPNVIGSKSGQRNGRGTFALSEKRRRNILMSVTLLRHVRSDRSGYICNVIKNIQDRRSRGW